MPEVKRAMEGGKILIKGGTTVSAVAMELVGVPLRVSGYIGPTAARAQLTSEEQAQDPHSILISEGGKTWEPLDALEGPYKAGWDRGLAKMKVVLGLGAEDVIIIGANAIDPDGNCASAAGDPIGGGTGPALTGMMACGAKLIIACGLEKLIPTRLKEAVAASGVRAINRTVGIRAGYGLMPIIGRLITEKESLEMLANVKCTVVGSGGIRGAGGATHLVVEGTEEQVDKACQIVEKIKGADEKDFVVPKSIGL